MPWFFFDLVIENRSHHQGGMILEDEEGARERADSLADELRKARPELDRKSCFIRVTTEAHEEIYQTSLDPAPKWVVHSVRR